MQAFIRYTLGRLAGYGRACAASTPAEVPPRPDSLPQPSTIHTILDTARHEAGHALMAWFSPYVVRVETISIVPNEGISSGIYPVVQMSGTALQLYDYLVILMGGLAGVLLEKPAVCRSYFDDDLAQASNALEQIRHLGIWPSLKRLVPYASPRFDVTGLYASPPEAGAGFLLNDALEEARTRLVQYRELFDRLCTALLQRRVLLTGDLPAILGPRPWAPR